jgi:hypothetical protein
MLGLIQWFLQTWWLNQIGSYKSLTTKFGQGLENLAQEIYRQARVSIQELVNVAEGLFQTNCNQDN